MQLTVHRNTEDILEQGQSALEQVEAANNLMLGMPHPVFPR